MNQSRRRQRRVSLPSHLNKFILLCSILEMLVILLVLRNSSERQRSVSAFWWVVMAYPDLGVVGE